MKNLQKKYKTRILKRQIIYVFQIIVSYTHITVGWTCLTADILDINRCAILFY